MISSHPVRRRTVLAAGLALPAAAGLAACKGGEGRPEPGEPDRVTYLTGFGLFGREAPAYVALEKGYFAEQNLTVDVQPGEGTVNNITQVVEGGADFVLGDFTGVLIGWANGDLPREFAAVAAIQQQTVFAIFALASSGIRVPQDLVGRTVGDGAGSVGDLLFPAYAAAVGINPDEVDYNASFSPPDLPGLLATGAVDAAAQFVMGEPTFEAVAEGEDVVVLPWSDVLRDLYGNACYCSAELARDNPGLVRRFVTALMRGMEDAVADPQGAGRIVADANPEGPPAEVNAAEVTLMAPYVQPVEAAAPLGSMDPERVRKSIGILQSAGAIPEDSVLPDDVVAFSLVPGGGDS